MRYLNVTDNVDIGELEGNQFTKPRKADRREFSARDEGKWRPFWQRGHITVDEANEKLREREEYALSIKRSAKNNPKLYSSSTRLYHSTVDLTRTSTKRKKRKNKMSKSVSMQGGLHNPVELMNRRGTGISRTSSTLNLPLIEPDIDINGTFESRDNSALSVAIHSTNGRNSNNHENEAESEIDSADEEVYQSDDDPEISRRNLDKAGDYIVEHDWILKENLAKDARKIKTKHKLLVIPLPDDDPLDSIKTRVDEIQLMVKPKAEYGNFIDTIDPSQRDKILKYKGIDHNEIRRKKRKNWTGMERFRDAAHNVLLLYRACHPRRKYLNDDKPDTSPDGVKKIKQKNVQEREVLRKSSLGYEMLLALICQPQYRSEDDVKRVMWMLRATKAFKHLFPAQLEEKLASLVAYERYDDRRIIAQQGRDPERFYYVLTGKLNKVREYRLLSGVVTREEGNIEKGNTTDPQEMMQNWPREHHLVTKGNAEVLILEKKDFLELLHTSKGPPIGFLQSLDLFKEFPCEEFRDNPDAIDFRYYGQDKMIVKDTNRTPWLHVVKTGHVKVVRAQTVIDVHNDDKFSSQTTTELGCVRPFSHASAMLGLLASQRKMKTLVGAISFPEVTQRPVFERSRTELSVSQLLKGNKDAIFDNPLTRRFRPSLIPPNSNTKTASESESLLGGVKKKQKSAGFDETSMPLNDSTNTKKLSDIREDSENATKRVATPTLTVTSPLLKSPKLVFNGNGLHTSPSPKSPLDKENNEKTLVLPPINDNRKTDAVGADFVPHGTYLTREKTEVDSVYSKKQKKEIQHRKTYLQLDVLKPGDIFGLDGVAELFRSMYPLNDRYAGLEHMEPQALASEAPGVTLISDGAEIIKISKRFFLQHAQNNTMLKVETMQREYMTADEAKDVMYNKETWNQYKSVLLQRTVNNLHRNHVEKVP